MKKFKRILATLLSTVMLLGFASCSQNSSNGTTSTEWTVETVFAAKARNVRQRRL